MKKKTSCLAFVLFLFILFSLCGCGMQPIRYQILEPYGYYPETEDFPDTKWVCKEVDMWFYMFDYGEPWMIGEYTVDGETYPFRARFNLHYMHTTLGFYFESPETNISFSESLDWEGPSSVTGDYIYKDDCLVFKISQSEASVWKYEGKTLTFEMEGTIANEPEARWRCQELDMYLDSFPDVENYYKGQLQMGDQTYDVSAIATPNDSNCLFKLAYKGDTVVMRFERKGDRMIATIVACETNEFEKECWQYWNYEDETLTFVREEISQ